MEELIRDPAWTFVGVVCAILAVVVTIFIFFAQRKIKRLSYEITSNTQLLGVEDEIQGKVQVLCDGKEVKNVHLLTIRFLNNGNQSISSSDYERPLSIEINLDAKVLTHEVIDEAPENLGATVALEGSKLIFSPVLMNAKDSFSIKTLISDFEGNPTIDGRINGVKSISKYRESQWPFLIISIISFVLIGVGALNFDKQGVFSVLGIETSAGKVGVALFITGYILMMVGMIKNKLALPIVREMVKAGLGAGSK
jgi:hypothetical protein